MTDGLDELLDQLLGRGLEHAGTGVDGKAWAELTGTGLHRVGISEELHGSGGDRFDATTVVAGAAQAGLGVPLTEALFPVAHLAAATGRPVGDGLVTAAVLAPGAGGEVSGVPWAADADELWLVIGARLTVLPQGAWQAATATNPAGEPRDDITVDPDAVAAEPLRPEAAQEVLELSALGRSAQILGAARACLALTLDHVTTRHQFGRPLAAHQVVRHELAALACEVAAAEAAVAHAVGALPEAGGALEPHAQLAVAAAKVQCGRCATRVARGAHQLHGAVGITAEHPLHHLTTRLWAWRDEAGPGRWWSARIGELVHGPFGSDLWAALTSSDGRTSA
jgi:acyl-CoA dehydrogenase